MTIEPVATPTNSPEPRLSEQTPPDDNRAPHPLPWGDPELPLDEEKPEEVMMENKRQLCVYTHTYTQLLYVHISNQVCLSNQGES